MRLTLIVMFVFVMLQTAFSQTVRLATYRYGNDNRLKSLQPYALHLEKKYGYKTSLKSYPTLGAFIKGIQQNEVDIAFINTVGYLALESAGKSYPMHAGCILQSKQDVADGYRTAIIVGPQVTATKLSDLKKEAAKLRLTLVNTGSTSGNLVPRMALAHAGLPLPEKLFKSVLYSDIHDAAVQAVLTKMADVAAVGYSQYEKYLQEDVANKSKMRLLWLSPEIPYGPIMFNNRFGTAIGAELLNSFTNLHQENKAAFEVMKSGWSETKDATKFIPINNDYYSNFKRVLGDEANMQRVLKQVMNGQP
jgi:phosphonate transport system substrate-binding protein